MTTLSELRERVKNRVDSIRRTRNLDLVEPEVICIELQRTNEDLLALLSALEKESAE